jgi:hypothetical protein
VLLLPLLLLLVCQGTQDSIACLTFLLHVMHMQLWFPLQQQQQELEWEEVG